MKRLELIACIGVAVLVAGCHGIGPKGPQFDARVPEAATEKPSALPADFKAVPAEQQVDSGWLKSPTNFFTLGPGDQLEVEVIGELGTRDTVTVGPDGKIYYFLLPGIDVQGSTLSQVKTNIESRLTEFLRGEPRVNVTLRAVESKRVWVLGRLGSPGIYSLSQPMTLLEAIAGAGGLASAQVLASTGASAQLSTMSSGDDTADLRRSFILRDGKLMPVDFTKLLREGDLSQNIYLQTGDFVYLPPITRRQVYVMGAVATPQAVSYQEPLTLVGAIANAGGTIPDAYLSHVAIVRGSLTEPKIAVIDYRDIVKGRAPDVWLEERDIVYVPITPYRTLTRYVDIILSTFVRTVGANEGARAVSRNAPAAGVNVPIGIAP